MNTTSRKRASLSHCTQAIGDPANQGTRQFYDMQGVKLWPVRALNRLNSRLAPPLSLLTPRSLHTPTRLHVARLQMFTSLSRAASLDAQVTMRAPAWLPKFACHALHASADRSGAHALTRLPSPPSCHFRWRP